MSRRCSAMDHPDRPNLRTIAPRPQARTPPEEPATPSDSGSRSSRPSRQRRNISSACRSCRQRRTKCDGNRPCSKCIESKAECTYQRNLDGRSSSAIRRKNEEIHRDQKLLNDLLTTIRDTTDENVTDIVGLIRSRAPLDEIKIMVSQRLAEIENADEGLSLEFSGLQDSLEWLDSLP